MATAKEFLLDWDILLKEKYLSFDKEKRITRIQFFYRMIIPGILLDLFILLPSVIVWIIFDPDNILIWSFYLSIFFHIIYLFIIFKFYPVLIKKRAQDFWKEWKIETITILGLTLLMTFYAVYVKYLILIAEDIEWVMSIEQYSSSIVWPINWILTIVWLYIVFRPWTKWVNKYWEQKYYKIKFLG